MLKAIGVKNLDDLFADVPPSSHPQKRPQPSPWPHRTRAETLFSMIGQQQPAGLRPSLLFGGGPLLPRGSGGGEGGRDPARIPDLLYPLPARDRAGNAASPLRLPDLHGGTDRPGGLQCLALRRRLRRGRGRAFGLEDEEGRVLRLCFPGRASRVPADHPDLFEPPGASDPRDRLERHRDGPGTTQDRPLAQFRGGGSIPQFPRDHRGPGGHFQDMQRKEFLPGGGGGRGHEPGPPALAGIAWRGCLRGKRPILRQYPVIRRAPRGLPDRPIRGYPPNARAASWARRPTATESRLRAHLPSARTAYPPRKGGQQRLHHPVPHGQLRLGLALL